MPADSPMVPEAMEADARERLARQLDFGAEVDKLKLVERMISVIGGSRLENSAEHSWHLALLAPILVEYTPAGVDLSRVMTMLLVHDVVEIDAGDTFAFDEEAYRDKEARERAAADRLFGLLPDDQAESIRDCWEEFEAGESAEARYANALDRFQGLLMNHHNGGGTWHSHGITREQVLRRMAPIEIGAPRLWEVVLAVVDQAGLESEATA